MALMKRLQLRNDLYYKQRVTVSKKWHLEGFASIYSSSYLIPQTFRQLFEQLMFITPKCANLVISILQSLPDFILNLIVNPSLLGKLMDGG